MSNDAPKTSQLINFKPGYDPRRNLKGRKKKYETILKEKGYAKSEVVEAISILMSMDEAAITEVAQDEESTVLEKIVASALLESIRKKTLYNIDILLTRVYGQPKQEIEQNVNVTAFNITLNLNGDVPPKPID